jgi:hypothetical protein
MESDWGCYSGWEYDQELVGFSSINSGSSSSSGSGYHEDQRTHYKDFYGGQSSDIEEEIDDSKDVQSRASGRKRKLGRNGKDSGNLSSHKNFHDCRRTGKVNRHKHKNHVYGSGDDLIDQVLSWDVEEGDINTLQNLSHALLLMSIRKYTKSLSTSHAHTNTHKHLYMFKCTRLLVYLLL